MSIGLITGFLWNFGLVSVAFFVFMAVRSRAARGGEPGAGRRFSYLVLIPCRDEARVIRRTLDSLRQFPPDRLQVVVVDDGSTDGTATIVGEFPEVVLVRRPPAEGGKGKGAALNAGFSHVVEWSDPAAVVGVLDADGRLDRHALDVIDEALGDDRVGAVQLGVRIGNRGSVLGRFQDLEFVSFSHIMQAARQRTGTVGLGGNGQFVRLSLLQQLGPEPWSSCLTEDLDLGLRISAAGWRIRFADGATVAQQGVSSLRALVRQRARWLQGHLQCWRHAPHIWTADIPPSARADLLAYLFGPVVLMVAALSWGLGLVSVLLGLVLHGGPRPGPMASEVALVLRIALTAIPCGWLAVTYRRRSGDSGWGMSTAIGCGIIVYNMVWCVALGKACWAQLAGRSAWDKTTRTVEPWPGTLSGAVTRPSTAPSWSATGSRFQSSPRCRSGS